MIPMVPMILMTVCIQPALIRVCLLQKLACISKLTWMIVELVLICFVLLSVGK